MLFLSYSPIWDYCNTLWLVKIAAICCIYHWDYCNALLFVKIAAIYSVSLTGNCCKALSFFEITATLCNTLNPLHTFPRNFPVEAEVADSLRSCYLETVAVDFGLYSSGSLQCSVPRWRHTWYFRPSDSPSPLVISGLAHWPYTRRTCCTATRVQL